MGVISNLPQDSLMTQWLLDAGALQLIFSFLSSGNTDVSHKREVVENASKALSRFTLPTNYEWQMQVVEMGFIPLLVELLVSGCLATPETGCPVHSGICSIEFSFCLLEANAITPLVRVLEEQHIGACEGSLHALLTLIEGDLLQKGTKVLAEANAIGPMIKLLRSGSEKLQEKALKALERIFRLVEFKQQYGSSSQMLLVDITQMGSSMKSLAAKTLAHLNVLPYQSSLF